MASSSTSHPFFIGLLATATIAFGLILVGF